LALAPSLLKNVKPASQKRVLKCTWTAELEQNLTAYYNIDAGEELMRILNEEISKEIDEEMMNTVLKYT